MESRLMQLLGSIVTATTAYALARLEFALEHPELPAPPVIDRLSEQLDTDLERQWDRTEVQLDEAHAFLREHGGIRRRRTAEDSSFAWLQRTVRELDQYARAMRWVLTVDSR